MKKYYELDKSLIEELERNKHKPINPPFYHKMVSRVHRFFSAFFSLE